MGRNKTKVHTPDDIPFHEVKTHLLRSLRNVNLPATRHSVMCVLLMWWTLIENNDHDREKRLWWVIENHFMNKSRQIQWLEEEDPKKQNTEGERLAESKDAAKVFDNVINAWGKVLPKGGENGASDI